MDGGEDILSNDKLLPVSRHGGGGGAGSGRFCCTSWLGTVAMVLTTSDVRYPRKGFQFVRRSDGRTLE